MARCVPFHTHLKNGEDTPFYCEIYARFPLIKLNADDDNDRCVYYRLMRSGSLSRQPLDYGFNVRERLAVIKEISRTLSLTQDKAIHSFNLSKIIGQIGFINQYLQSFPNEYIRVTEEINSYNIQHFPMDRLKGNSTAK
ncbi:hypothetical protein HED49_19610 [Ochrobactrum daejeonense]|nr:hypothetical protein [Brucella daejeonensis]